MEDAKLLEIRKRRRNEKSQDSLSPTRKPILRDSQFTTGTNSKRNPLWVFQGLSTSSDKIPTTLKPLIESQKITQTQQDYFTARTGSSHHSVASSSAATQELLGRCRGYSMSLSDEIVLLESRDDTQNRSIKNKQYKKIPFSGTQQTFADSASQTEQLSARNQKNYQYPCQSCLQFQEMVYKLIAENKRLQGIIRQKQEKIANIEEDYAEKKDQLLQAEENVLILSAEIRALKGQQQQSQSNYIFTPLPQQESIIPDSKLHQLASSSSQSFIPSISSLSYRNNDKSPIQNIHNHSPSPFNKHNTSGNVRNITNKLLHRSQNGVLFHPNQENSNKYLKDNMNQANSLTFSHSNKRKNKIKHPNYNSAYQFSSISTRNSSLQEPKSSNSSSKLDLQFLNLQSKNNSYQAANQNNGNLTNNSLSNDRYKNFNKSTEIQITNRLFHEQQEKISFHISQPGRTQTDLLQKEHNQRDSVKDPAESSNYGLNLNLENSSLSDGHSNLLQQLNSNRIQSSFLNYAKNHSNNSITNNSNETRASRQDNFNQIQQKQQSLRNSNGKNKWNYTQRDNYLNHSSSISPYPQSCDQNKQFSDENSNPLLSHSLKQQNSFKQRSKIIEFAIFQMDFKNPLKNNLILNALLGNFDEDRHSSMSSQQVYSFGGSQQQHSSIPLNQDGHLKGDKDSPFLMVKYLNTFKRE